MHRHANIQAALQRFAAIRVGPRLHLESFEGLDIAHAPPFLHVQQLLEMGMKGLQERRLPIPMLRQLRYNGSPAAVRSEAWGQLNCWKLNGARWRMTEGIACALLFHRTSMVRFW